jgi:3-oxoacyl-[acyl-carrier protein] reductase
MLLQGKTALIFAATGAIGSVVARRFADEGARVFVSGRDEAAVARLSKSIGAGGSLVDATDERQVTSYIEQVHGQCEGIDIVFNAIGPRVADALYATSAVELPLDKFMLPLRTIVASQFLTARSAARFMTAQRRGAIVLLSASLSGQFVPFMSGITAACGAIEGLTHTLAAEFGPGGVRVNCVRAGGMPETRTILETTAAMAKTLGSSVEDASRPTVGNVLGRPLRVEETAAAVAYLASDDASGIAGQVVNVCAGAIAA